jgi:aminoglycoside phosphotransferase (APT) family kinase protein
MTDFSDQPSAVRDGQAFDVARLEPWLRANVPGVDGAVSVEQFGRGFSNLTYLIRAGGRELVLRRAPPGVKIKSAHDMGREYRILSGLAKVWHKSPKPLARCDDEALIGTPFYVMERVRGVILRKALPAGLTLDAATMKRLSESLVDTLAEIHGTDLAAAGLGDLGKPEGYVERQITGWAERYEKAKTDDVADFDEVRRWLVANRPADSAGTLIHNDFKYDNVVLDEKLQGVAAVLDWEMATLGDPLMDLGTALGYWIEADDPPVFQVMVFGPTHLPGSLRRTELVRRYADATGRDVSNVLFYFVFALFKLAVVGQQLYKRYKDGLTQEPRFAMMGEGVKAISAAARVAIEKGRIDRLAE